MEESEIGEVGLDKLGEKVHEKARESFTFQYPLGDNARCRNVDQRQRF